MGLKTIILTAGTTSWTVPTDWTDAGSIIRCIGGGGGGGRNAIAAVGGGGGGGGGFSSVSAIGLTAGSVITVNVGSGGLGSTTDNTAGAAGDATWFNGSSLATSSVGANGGSGGGASASGAGGSTTGAIGTVKFAGGAGGPATGVTGGTAGGGGGGSAATDLGNGFAGAQGGTSNGGGGGGTGGAASGINAGVGYAKFVTTSGAGQLGTGGIGASTTTNPGTAGGAGPEYLLSDATTVGSGGGGGGSRGDGNNGLAGAAGGLYGGGGAGGGAGGNVPGNGGNGGAGAIIITYNSTTTYYWVGGSGTWDGTTTTNWATSSGGTGGAGVPTAGDNVVFDVNSDTGTGFTVTIATGAKCYDCTISGLDQTMTLAGTGAWTIAGGLTLPSTNFTRTYSGAITFAGTASTSNNINTNGVSLASSITVNGINGGWVLQNNLTTTSGFTLTTGTMNVSTYTLSCIALTNGTTSNYQTRALTFGSGGKISVTGSGASAVSAPTLTNFTYTGTSNLTFATSGITASTINWGATAGTESAAVNLYVTAFSGTLTITTNSDLRTVDFTGSTATCSSGFNIFGNLVLATGGGYSSMAPTFSATSGTQTITTNGRTIGAITQSGSGGTVSLQDALTCASYTTTSGTLTTNSNQINLSSTGTVWSWAGTTLNLGTSKISLTSTSASARTFAGGGQTYPHLEIGGATGVSAVTISGSNTFNTLSSVKTSGHTINFTAGTTNTIANWLVKGTAGNVVAVQTNSSGTAANLSITNKTSGINYLSVRDINCTSLQPITFYAGPNSTNTSNNSGVAFLDSTNNNIYVLTGAGTSWVVPSGYNASNNTIHLFGAGGGGATGASSGNNRAAGGGGGGGGYTRITNFSTTAGSTITYAIGAGGAAGIAGGNTTWNAGAFSANGGGAGSAATTPSSTGGTGGTGSTFNGGAGGAGAFGTAASTGYGSGGGGGAGGPNGVGASGGIGFATTGSTSIAGGGGGGNGGGSNGGNASSGTGGTGGNNSGGTGGGASNAAGILGGGAGGATGPNAGTQGGIGFDVLGSFGGSGGGGGRGNATGSSSNARTGSFGGGGGGGGVGTTGTTGNGSPGANGGIIIYWSDAALPPRSQAVYVGLGG